MDPREQEAMVELMGQRAEVESWVENVVTLVELVDLKGPGNWTEPAGLTGRG